MNEPISPSKFYNKQRVAIKRKKFRKACSLDEYPRMSLHLIGLPEFWLECDKQANALVKAYEKSTDAHMLCTFVSQRENGYRKFIVAHPEVYWWRYVRRPPEKRCSYEVIPENSPCRLYLDLEYFIALNPESDGPSMTNTIVDIFAAYLLKHWGLPCNKYNTIDLDSSTPEKFSRHIILNIKHIAFKDNYHVGRLVKSVCNDISNYLSTDGMYHDVLNQFDRTQLKQLFVNTYKGNKLFIDTAVYTKNRHFRIYKSTKWGKQSNLTISKDCKYIPSNLHKGKELGLFLDSLISYFVAKPDLILLEYPKIDLTEVKRFTPEKPKYICHEYDKCYSNYPTLDEYIRKKIHPGKIRACKYFECSKTLVYETLDYRFCENIGRRHKSNNVFLIVDIKNKILYQKCHDEDCSGFKSEPKRLPDEISFQIDDAGDVMLLSCIAIEDST
nr:DNA-directed primase/polymerase protein-like [Nomia melanderi]